MKITATKVKKELSKKYGWVVIDGSLNIVMGDELIKDTLKVVNEILMYQKNISLK